MSVRIYHNPRCGKSRTTLKLLEEHGIEAKLIHYLVNPPSEEELKQLLQKLALPVTGIIRFKEERAKELGIKKTDARSEEEWIDILLENPKLIERPIVVSGEKAVLGRPPENVLELIE